MPFPLPHLRASRREFLASAIALAATGAAAYSAAPANEFGFVAYSYGMRMAKERSLSDPLQFLRFCRERGAGGLQTSIPVTDAAASETIRRFLDGTGMWLEGIIRLPRDAADLDRFDADLRAVRATGASVARTTLVGSRRYEAFRTPEAYAEAKSRAVASLRLVEPVAARRKVRLAVENHKDLRAEELAKTLKELSSPWVGACVDLGNNLALLEEPMETLAALAPWALACHLKDMAVEETPTGFLLSEVPLGRGFLDLPAMAGALRKSRPEIRFSIEMITRDPLSVPCLTDAYWESMEGVPARALARTISLVRREAPRHPVTRLAGLSEDARLQREEANARECLAYARDRLRARS